MGATFIAYGPVFRHGVTLPPTQDVKIYNLLCATLGLTPAPSHETCLRDAFPIITPECHVKTFQGDYQ
jgi:hypothetical protein